MGSCLTVIPKRHFLHGNTSYNIMIIKLGPPVWARRKPKNKVKRYTKKPKHVTSHVFAKTIHLVTATHGFACAVTTGT